MVFITVGRKVECNWVQEPGTTNTHHDWNFGVGALHIVDNYNPGQQAAVITPKTNWRAMRNSNLDLYTTRGEDYPFTTILSYFIHTERDHPIHEARRQGTVRIASPTVTTGAPRHQEFDIRPLTGPAEAPGYGWLRLGNGFTNFGFELEATVELPILPDELADGPGQVGFVQLVQCTYEYRTHDGREMRYSTGAEFMLDGSFPYDGWEALAAAGAAEPNLIDSPYLPMFPYLSMAGLELSFKVYLMYKSNSPDSIWVSLGNMTWSAEATALKGDAVDAEWELDDSHVMVSPWSTTTELPTWTRNGNDIDALWEAEKQRVLTPAERAQDAMLPIAEIIRRRNDYRAYLGTYNQSEGSWETYKRDFELRFNCVIVFAGPQRFHTWILPEVAGRARGYRTTTLTEVPAGDKWMHPKAGYYPPFGWETQWTLYLAPLCFANSGEDKVYEYWRAFSDFEPKSLASNLQSKLARMTVSADPPSGFGRFPITFSRPLWEEDMNIIAGLPFVFLMEPKSHFGDKYLNLMAYLPGHPNVFGRDGYWIGEKGTGKIVGLNLDPMTSDLTLEYMGHIANSGDTGWISYRHWLGGTAGDKAIEGFAIRLTGDARSKYNLSYKAYLHGTGDTGLKQAGEFCGTRGQSRPIEAIQVFITRKSGDDPILE